MDCKLITRLYARLLAVLVVMIGSMGYLFSAMPERLMTGQTLEFLEENKTFMFVGNWEKGYGHEDRMRDVAALVDIEIRFHAPQNYDDAVVADPAKVFGVYLKGDGDAILLFLEVIHLDPDEFIEVIERLKKNKVPKHIV